MRVSKNKREVVSSIKLELSSMSKIELDVLHSIILNRQPLENRFWLSVDTGDSEECWQWTGSLTVAGYGSIDVLGKTYLAHRVSYMLKHGDILKGMHVCHRCDNPVCVNPSHLFLGTHRENMEDKKKKGRCATSESRVPMATVLEIRKLYNEGLDNATISRKFNVNYAITRNICRNKSYKQYLEYQFEYEQPIYGEF